MYISFLERCVAVFEQIRNGLRTKFECLKVTSNHFELVSKKLLAVLSRFKTTRNLLEFKLSKHKTLWMDVSGWSYFSQVGPNVMATFL